MEGAFNSLKTKVDTIQEVTIQGDLTAIVEQVQSNTSKIEANKDSINTLISQDTVIKKQVTDLQGTLNETETTLNSKYTSLSQNLNGFKTTVADTYATKKSVTDVVDNIESNYSTTSVMNSAIEQKAQEISASVSSTYATKNQVNTLDNNLKSNYSTTQQMESAIDIAKEEINLGVSSIYETKTNVESKVNGIQIGGRNLARQSNRFYKGTGAPGITSAVYNDGSLSVTAESGNGNWFRGFIITSEGIEDSFNEGDDFTISFIASSYDTTTIPDIHIKEGMGYYPMKGTLSSYDSVIYYSGKWKKENSIGLHLGFKGIVGTITFRKWKIEKGNKPTDWTPAPEDIVDDISVAKQEAITSANNTLTSTISNYYTKSQTDSQINIAKEEINLGVSSIYETKTNVESKVTSTLNSAKSYSDTKKSEAISTAASDATSKANTAKQEAIISANNTLSSTISNYYTKSQTDSQISIAKEEINLGVSSIYETKEVVESKTNTALNNAKSYADTKKSEAISTASEDATSKANTAKNDAIASANNTLNTTIANYYTKTETDSQINVAKDAVTTTVSNLRTEVMSASYNNLLWNSDFLTWENDFPKGYYSTNRTYCFGGGWICPDGGRTIAIDTSAGGVNWQGFQSSTIKVRQDQTLTASVYVAIDNEAYRGSVNFGIEILWMGEDGSKIAQSGNPFTIDTVYNWERHSVTGTAPEGTAKAIVHCWNQTTGVSWWGKPMLQFGSVMTAWTRGGDLERVDERLNYAEQKITDDAITNTVKQNFYTKQETENSITSKGYATSSQVQQTADNLQIKFTESGGYNLLKNGKAALNTNFWTNNGGGIARDSDAVYKTCFKTTLPSGIKYNGGDNGGAIRLKNNTHYVYEAMVFSRTAIEGNETVPLHYWCNTTAEAGGRTQCTVVDYSQKVANNTWTKCYVHFVTKPSGEVWFTPIVYTGGSLTGDIRVTELSLSESSIQMPYSPHPSEVYDGLTQIDKNGIKVSTSKGAYTQFSSDGMSSFNNSSQQTLGIKNGGITFHPYSSNQLGAYITQSALWNGNASANGLAISTANNGTYIALGTSSLSDANETLDMDQALTISSNDNFQPRGINFWKDVNTHGYGIRQLSHLQLADSGAIQFDYLHNSPSTIYEAVDNGHSLYIMGGYQMHLGVMEGSGEPHAVIWMRDKTNTHSYTHWDFHNYTMYNMKTASTYANYSTRRIGESYGVTSNVDGVRYLYKNVELVNGKAIRSIPREYEGCEYDIVSIVCKGKGSAWVETEDENRFEINGECKSVNIEIIIYPSEAVMTASTQQLEEAPTLELPKKTEPEEALLITNEA